MTTPDERRRTLVQAGAFLKELRGNQSLPEAVRQEAHRLEQGPSMVVHFLLQPHLDE